jgi:hypothetical protein
MKKIFLFSLLHISFGVAAQTETTIRNHYTEVNTKIKESLEQGFEGSLYQNQIVINKNGKSWPAVGTYEEKIDFWYDDVPDHISPQERNPKNVLLKVHVSRHNVHQRNNEEYLYKDGRLLFYYSSMEEEGNQWEVRVYYTTKGVAIKTSVKENGKELTAKELSADALKDYRPNPVKILSEGKKYQEVFLKTM